MIGFPSYSFKQEIKDDAGVAKFCKLNYGVTFPLTTRVAVTGDKATPIFKYLTKNAPKDKKGAEVAWNFEKFIVDKNGKVKYRFRSGIDPASKEFKGKVAEVLK